MPFPHLSLFCFWMTSLGWRRRACCSHTKMVRNDHPSKDVRNFSHAGGASWNQVAGMRCPTGKTQPYNRNQRPEVRSLAGELGRTPHSLLFVSLINAWKLPPCFELEHFGSDKKFVYSPADGSLRKSFRIFFDSIIKTRWVFFTLK